MPSSVASAKRAWQQPQTSVTAVLPPGLKYPVLRETSDCWPTIIQGSFIAVNLQLTSGCSIHWVQQRHELHPASTMCFRLVAFSLGRGACSLDVQATKLRLQQNRIKATMNQSEFIDLSSNNS